MNAIQTILLDMDDVLCDCTGACLRHMGLHDFKREDYGIDDRDIYAEYERITGIRYSPAQFWEHFKREFWASIEPTPWCYDLIDLCAKYVPTEQIALCTSPTKCGDCLAGKLDWIEEHLPKWMHRQYLMTPRKHFCAARGHVLIDDASENTKAFTEAGGWSVTFPQAWNHCREYIGEELEYVAGWLNYYAALKV